MFIYRVCHTLCMSFGKRFHASDMKKISVRDQEFVELILIFMPDDSGR